MNNKKKRVFTQRENEEIQINDFVKIKVAEIGRKFVKISVEAPNEFRLERLGSEVREPSFRAKTKNDALSLRREKRKNSRNKNDSQDFSDKIRQVNEMLTLIMEWEKEKESKKLDQILRAMKALRAKLAISSFLASEELAA